jgi:hypothetical protein
MHLVLNRGRGSADTVGWPHAVQLPGPAEFADLNGDGRPDLVFVDSDVRRPAVIVALGVGEGLPIQEGRYPLRGRGGRAVTGDVDNDGDIDLVVYERAVDREGGVHVLLNRLADGRTAVEDEEEDVGALPPGFTLASAYPNPFNPQVTIPVVLAAAQPRARLVIHSLLGQPVRTLVDGPLPAGEHRAVWDGRDQRGRSVPSGVYIYRLEAGGRSVSGRCVRIE